MEKLLVDRIDAGERLVKKLGQYEKQKDVIVLALPRGGVPVAYVIAKALKVPLDVFLVRKLGVPWQEELAMGAIASGDVTVFNHEVLDNLQLSKQDIDRVIAKEKKVLKERERKYMGDHQLIDVKGKTVILVDDGIATGSTIRAAIQAIKKLGCEKIVVAIPVAPFDAVEQLSLEVDEVYYLFTPEPFYAIGSWYQDFGQTSDAEVISLLNFSRQKKD